MALSTETPKHLIPDRPDPAWLATLAKNTLVAVVDPVPRRVVYLATVKRITPTGQIRLSHVTGGEAETFRKDGYRFVRRDWRNPWPRYLVAPDQPAAESSRKAGVTE